VSDWIDISVPLSPGVVRWPGDREFEIRREATIEGGGECNLSSFSMCAHTGTHVDAPLHYLAGGAPMDAVPFDVLIGRARVVETAAARIGVEELSQLGIAAGERLLFKTRNSAAEWHDRPFRRDFAHLTPAGARHLAERGVRLAGIDYLSIGGEDVEGTETHRILLEGGVWILEAVCLHGVAPGNYELVCLPLRIAGIEGAPARAILRRRD
jgi:arylformamidase